MDKDPALSAILDAVATGKITPAQAMESLATGPVARQPLHYATLDTDRNARTGFAEVVYGAGKTPLQCVGIATVLLQHQPRVLFTRLTPKASAGLKRAFPEHVSWSEGRTFLVGTLPESPIYKGRVVVVTAGTSDLPVAEECMATLLTHGADTQQITDVGVAGIHRILAQQVALRAASVIVVVAGMDGALPSVVGGLVGNPVISVPTSVGYGAAFGGVAPLLTMLNACASGVTVVNIDNGFGAAMAALRILQYGQSTTPETTLG